MEHVDVQVSWQSLMGVGLVVTMVTASTTATASHHPLAVEVMVVEMVVVGSVGHALVLGPGVVVVAGVGGGGHVARVLGDAQHPRRVGGQCGRGGEVGMGRGAVQVWGFVAVGLRAAVAGAGDPPG